jgi:ATP-dependent Lon protease
VAVRHDIALSGEITILGKVLGVGGIQPKFMAAIGSGVKTVVLPAENERDVLNLPDDIRNRIEVKYVTEIQQVLEQALVPVL